MQLAITALGNNPINFMAEILAAVGDCKCNILEIRSTCLAQATAAYLLVQGNWNQIAKLEAALESIERKLAIKVHSLRPEPRNKQGEFIPYSLETLSLDRDNVVESITTFLLARDIAIEEIIASSYQAPYIQNTVFSSKFVILIPPQQHLLSLREEFMDFCDQLNIDAILEPIKR